MYGNLIFNLEDYHGYQKTVKIERRMLRKIE